MKNLITLALLMRNAALYAQWLRMFAYLHLLYRYESPVRNAQTERSAFTAENNSNVKDTKVKAGAFSQGVTKEDLRNEEYDESALVCHSRESGNPLSFPRDDKRRYVYDDAGNLSKKRKLSGNNKVWQYYYTPENRLAMVIRPNKSRVYLFYDATGRRISQYVRRKKDI